MLMQLLIALFAGAFVGIQREMYINEKKDKLEFLGIRSSIFLSILWVISTFFITMPYLPVIIFFAVLILVAISHAAGSFKLERPWMTTELSTFLIFWVWVLIGFGQEAIAIILVIVLTSVNTFRSQIDNFVDALNHKEWLAALQLLVFSGAVLPILPNKPFSDLLVWINNVLLSEKDVRSIFKRTKISLTIISSPVEGSIQSECLGRSP